MVEAGDDPLARLGLPSLNKGPQTIHLSAGVVVTLHSPVASYDWKAAADRLVKAFAANDMMKTAIARYAIADEDVPALANPENWEGLSELFVAAELGAALVEKVERRAFDGTLHSLKPSLVEMLELLRLGENLTAFVQGAIGKGWDRPAPDAAVPMGAA
jgi:hypothetical protein